MIRLTHNWKHSISQSKRRVINLIELIDVLEILDELEDDIQSMREEGETDLRQALTYVRNARYKVKDLD